MREHGKSGVANLSSPSVLAYPIHGHTKLLTEGYRTRDGHIIEWLARRALSAGPVQVFSRPEPLVKQILDHRRMTSSATDVPNTLYIDKTVLRLPNLTDRHRWWADSAMLYPPLSPAFQSVPAVIWNPFIGSSSQRRTVLNDVRVTLFDLLDDWTIHYNFVGIRHEVDEAYKRVFDKVDHVTANSEGTLDLAHRYGRSDAVLLTNGCDPERFSTSSQATGPITIGYVGKLGRRIDDDLIAKACAALPECNFVIAGPLLDGDLDRRLAKYTNCRFLGDVRYDIVPALLETFDLGWIPHKTGPGEVGGDAIKTYEYRAAGLPVLSTPIAGVGRRGLSEVHVVAADQQVEWMRDFFGHRNRIDRVIASIPSEATWEYVSGQMQKLLVPSP